MYECMNECMHVFGVQSVDYELASYHMQRPCSCQGQSKQAIRPVGVSATAGHCVLAYSFDEHSDRRRLVQMENIDDKLS